MEISELLPKSSSEYIKTQLQKQSVFRIFIQNEYRVCQYLDRFLFANAISGGIFKGFFLNNALGTRNE